jgi:hypothetical protein
MRFFFPDSQDQVDPLFDFVSEEHPVHRVRQRDDRYAHEVLKDRPFDGLLISKAIIDGRGGGLAGGRYSAAARNRLYREGAKRFFRLDRGHDDVVVMGDCGAFAYVNEEEPPYSVEEVADFYAHCDLDWGVAPDHIVFGFVRPGAPLPDDLVGEWERRRCLTIHNARQFLDCHERRQCRFEPIGVAHGYDPDSYALSVVELQNAGYQRIAMGGMVPLRTRDILLALERVAEELRPGTELHLLGITRTDEISKFVGLGVTSIDSTSPFRQAFKDDTDNYYTLDSTFVAVRVPQVDGNASLKRRVAAGLVDQREAIKAERKCLETLRSLDVGASSVDEALEDLAEYVAVIGERKPRAEQYRRTLEDRPWKQCPCDICSSIGIEVILFRGSERNKRRGFHNLAVFRQRLNRIGFPSLRPSLTG